MIKVDYPETSLLRGHKIKNTAGGWVYVDSNTSCTARRDCGHCGKQDTEEGHDGCLGVLSGVVNACCGHGVQEEAYVQFEDKSRISGRKATNYIKRIRGNIHDNPELAEGE